MRLTCVKNPSEDGAAVSGGWAVPPFFGELSLALLYGELGAVSDAEKDARLGSTNLALLNAQAGDPRTSHTVTRAGWPRRRYTEPPWENNRKSDIIICFQLEPTTAQEKKRICEW